MTKKYIFQSHIVSVSESKHSRSRRNSRHAQVCTQLLLVAEQRLTKALTKENNEAIQK